MHEHNCDCKTTNFSLVQSLEEIEFEKSIHNACIQGDVDKVRNMINKDGKTILKQQDKSGYSCLHYAARHSHYEICKLLIDNGIDLNLKTFSCGSTALHRASYIGNRQIVELLLISGCDSSIKDIDGKNALHKCVEQFEINKTNEKKAAKYLDTIKVLLKFNSNLKNDIDKANITPLGYSDDLKNYFNIF
jgi:ankyrin repeat protein